MLTYDAKAETISSKYNTYKLVDVDEALIYQWIKDGHLSMKAFDAWVRVQYRAAFADGAENEAFNNYTE